MTASAAGGALTLMVLLPAALAILAMSRRLRPGLFDLLPIAPLPGLAGALLAPRRQPFQLPDLLLGLNFMLDEVGGVFLGFISLLWFLAGWYARASLPGSARESAFSGFWYATLAGNLGVCIAADVITFYAFFAVLSLAAYGLVVHDGTARAYRAGRIYLVLAIIGETCLLFGVMLAVQAAQSIDIGAVRAGLAVSPERDLAILLLVTGFGVKVGLVPLHVWLPLAHPIAPTPASAVLSGAIVKAGILGLLRFLPLDAVLPGWGPLLIAAGLVTAYFGVLIGLTQSNPKTILAYSTVSQMGIVVTVIGAGLGPVPTTRTAELATLYALNHGLAKGALFLSAGVIAASGRVRWSVMLPTALVAGAIAGLPMTGGALAKFAIKGALTGPAALLVTLSAIGTALLLLRFLVVAEASRPAASEATPGPGLLVPWAAAVVAALVVPWPLFSRLIGRPLADALGTASMWAAAWPVVAAVLLAALAWRVRKRVLPRVPEGDLIVPVEAALRTSTVLARVELRAVSRRKPGRWLMRAWEIAGRGLDRSEASFMKWSLGGTALLTIALIVGAVLAG